jgi:aldehyde dehydrogenase (NAD+)
MQNALKFYINGEWLDPITPHIVDGINPTTEKPMGKISYGSTGDVDLAVAAAKQAFKTYSKTSREERIAYLEKILKGYKERWDELATATSEEMGAPISFAKGPQADAGSSCTMWC